MALLDKLKKAARSSAKEAYKKKVSDERKRKEATKKIEKKKEQKKEAVRQQAKQAYQKQQQAKQQQRQAVQKQQQNKKSWAERSREMAQAANVQRKQENRNALGTTTRTDTLKGKGWEVKSEQLSSEDYQKMQNALRMGGGADVANKAVGEDLAKKIGSRTAYSANRNSMSRFTEGALQGIAPVDVEKGIGTYGKGERKALKEAKESKAGQAGYMAGFAGSMALGGTSGMGKGVAETVGKGMAKQAAKKAAKTAVKEGVEEVAEKAGKTTAKKFVANRVGELAAEAPLNVADAAKMATDENGKVDKKKFAKYLGLNVGLTAGAGGAIEGVGMKLTKQQGKDLLKLQAKANAKGLTEKEGQKLTKLYDKLNAARQDTYAAKSGIADAAVKDAKKLENAGTNIEASAQKNVQNVSAVDNGQKAATTGREAVTEAPANQTAINTPAARAATEQVAPTAEARQATGQADNAVPERATVEAQEGVAKDATAPEKSAERQQAVAAMEARSAKVQEYANKPKAEQFKEAQPSLKELKKQAEEGGMSGYETSKHLESIYDAGHFAPEEIRAQLTKDLQEGAYKKVARESNEQAIENAQAAVEKDWNEVYGRQIGKLDGEDLTARDYAERKFVMEKLEDMIRNGDGDVDELVKKHRDLSISEVLNVSNTAAALNAAKIMKRMTPTGRAELMLKKVERLNKKYGDRLKGEKLELTDEQYNRILKAVDEEEAANVLDEINLELMEKIPSTAFEKINEARRFMMLFNLRTHGRNVIGNSMFAAARSAADAMEVAAYKLPAVRNRLAKIGGTVDANKLSYYKAVQDNKKFLNEQWDKVYNASGSQTRWKEALSKTGSPDAIKGNTAASKAFKKLIDFNYAALEKEDMWMFKPAFRRAYVQWCDARGIKDLSKMTADQMDQAGKYALHKAEVATFRDDSAFASKITGFKTRSAGKKGNTAIGTAAYRAGNMAIEGHLPFVKTPVNILSRSIDYSPVGIAKGVAKIARTTNPEQFKSGIHDVCSGMTGTGVALFGALLASQGIITVQAGNKSGDAFYDRDMGYQDYSLVVGPEGHQYSVSIDWAAPMQTTLFMGAAMQEKLAEDGFSMQDTMDIAVNALNPMMDMSFMSTSKDTFDSFMDKVYRNGTGDDADWTGAITQTLFGKVPQGYLGSLVPQMVGQVANATDKYQRETKSTNESAVAASWETWGRQLANKVPWLREVVNDAKVDRRGREKKQTVGDNIVTRFINTMVNPANVKKIDLDNTDKELIGIYNKIPDGTTEKKYFWYDFTGKPEFDLANGKRMTYKEMNDYSKTKRQAQNESIEKMFKAKSYDNMTNALKVKEIVNYKKDISNIEADRKVYGDDYALLKIVGGDDMKVGKAVGAKADKTAWEIFQSQEGDGKQSKKDFVNFWLTKENLIARAHDSGYNTKAMAVALSGNKNLGRAYNINTDKVKLALDYVKKKGAKAFDQFADASCNIASGLDKAGVDSTSKANKSWSAADYKIDQDTYRAMGFDWNSAQSGAGLRNKYGYDAKQLQQMAYDAKFDFDADANGRVNKNEIMAYIDSLGIKDDQEKACLFAYFSTAKNPYGEIDDYLKWGEDSRDEASGGRGRGRRGYRRGGWGHGGGGGGRGGGNDDWYKYAADIFSDSMPKKSTAKMKDNTQESELTDAYRRRVRRMQMANQKQKKRS